MEESVETDTSVLNKYAPGPMSVINTSVKHQVNNSDTQGHDSSNLLENTLYDALPIDDSILRSVNDIQENFSVKQTSGTVQENNVSNFENTIYDSLPQGLGISGETSVKEQSTSKQFDDSLYDSLPVDDSVIHNLEVRQSVAESTLKKVENVAATEVKESGTCAEKKQISSALSQLLDYGTSDSEDSDPDSNDSLSDSNSERDNDDNSAVKPKVESGNMVTNDTEFRENESDSSSTSEYESDSSSSFSDIGACGGTPAPENKKKSEKMSPPRTKGELALEDLPAIEELKISVPEDECVEIGVVSSIIDQLVIVQSVRGMPAYDIDTLLFLNRGSRPLGRVFDVLGPVREPLYAIRFNSYEQAIETGVKPGTPVYCAPRTQHTSFVFVSELMKLKGSDASWEHNNEPPEVFLDYSDDEAERHARRQLRKKPSPIDSAKTNSLERNKKFEKQMNDKNLLMNERYKNQQQPPIQKKKPDARVPVVGPPPPWLVRNASPPVARPEFWSAPPYQLAAYPPYGPVPMFPRQPFVQPVLGPSAVFHHPPPAFNPSIPPPNIPPPILRPQPVNYFPNPRHPRWGPPGLGVLQPPRGTFGNGSASYTQ